MLAHCEYNSSILLWTGLAHDVLCVVYAYPLAQLRNRFDGGCKTSTGWYLLCIVHKSIWLG